jgi:hypothetical protein
MKKSILEIYALAICFISVICFIVTAGIAVNGVFEVAYPSFTLSSYEYAQYTSNEAYKANHPATINGKEVQRREAELTKAREDSYKIALKNEQRSGLQNVVHSLIMFIIVLPIFIMHWIIARRARNATA